MISAIQYPVEAAGVLTRVVQWGRQGAPVLFVHGLGSHAGVWTQVAPQLAIEGRRCLAVDLPGHGLSSKGSSFRYTLAGHVDWLEALVDALNEPRIGLVASSLGGLWASGFAVRDPSRLSSLTLIGAVGLGALGPERRRWTAEYLGRMDRASVGERLRRAVGDPQVIEDSLIEETFRMNNSPGAAEAFAALGRYYLEGINDDMHLEALIEHAAELALLLVWGRDDATVAYGAARAAAARIPGATLMSLDGVKHVPQLEKPALVREALSKHLRGELLQVGAFEGGEVTR